MNDTPATPTVHVYFVLDRSGSMNDIRSDVIGGFNSFVEEQRAQPGRCLMTLIQFDGGDPHEVLESARPIEQVAPLSSSRFVPRGNTPLFDAMGHAIADATIRTEKLGAAGEPYEEIVFVTFTDGLENASREYTRTKIFELIRKRQESGWSFVYLGANQDAYAESEQLGYAPGSVQNFAADARGTRLAFSSTSGSLTRFRDKLGKRQASDRTNLFEGDKPADEDAKQRKVTSS
jgi:Mg-chelatase subunit ChlD